MDLPFLVSTLVAPCVGVPSMFLIRGRRLVVLNATAIALVLSWSIGMAWWLVTRKGVPLQIDILRDYLVLIVIFLKAGEEREPSTGVLGWAKDWWLQLTWWDKAIVCLFAPMWVTYAVPMGPFYAYWISWTAGVLQFLAAGAEAIERWRRGRARLDTDLPTDPSMSRLGLAADAC